MHIATFFESGKVRAIGYDKYKCPDTLEFDVDLESFYKEPNTDKRQAQFKPIFQPFSDLSSAKGKIDMRQLTGVYDGAYTYFVETISDGPEGEFKEIGAYHKIQFDSDSNKGYWEYLGNQMLVEHHKNGDSYEIHINDNGKIWKAQIIKLDDTILRLFYAETENQKIVEYYKVR